MITKYIVCSHYSLYIYVNTRLKCITALYTITHLKRPPKGWAFFERALVTVTLQPINYLLYLDNSAFRQNYHI